MIIDMHCHVGLSIDGGRGYLNEILANMETYGISQTALVATDESDTGLTFEAPNTRIFEASHQYSDMIVPFVRIVPEAGVVALTELKRGIKNGARGLKLKSLDGFTPENARACFDIIKDKEGFPILIHTAHNAHCSPGAWEPFFSEYPSLNFILAHGGKDLYKLCAKIIKPYKNAYADTTTLSFNRTRHLFEAVGPEKLVFGSDYPYSHPAIELTKYRVLIKDEGALDVIFSQNARRFLGM